MSCENNEEVIDIIIGSRASYFVDTRQEGRVFPLDEFDTFTMVFCPPGEAEIEFSLTPPTNKSAGEVLIELTAAQTATLSKSITDGYLKLDDSASPNPLLVPLPNKFNIRGPCD